MHVTRIRVYPVKSFGGVDVGSAEVLPWGLAADRRWGVIDARGEPMTGSICNALLGLTAEPLADGGVLLSSGGGGLGSIIGAGVSGPFGADGEGGGGGDALRVDPPTHAAPIPVGHSRQGTALPAGAMADEWLSGHLGTAVRLVWQPDPRARAVNPAHGGLPGESLSLADAGPLLLTSEASLARLDEWTGSQTPALDMLRFRPNVVVDGHEPFAEDEWPFVELGDVRFRVAEVCDRCVVTTIDPTTIARGPEPIRTLSKHRKWDGKTWFGIRLIPETSGAITVGDTVRPA
jgi:uncharacterized protein